MIEVGDKVKIRRFKINWGSYGAFEKRFMGKVGKVVEIYFTQPSKRNPNGRMIKVNFLMINKKTGKVGINHSFPDIHVDKLEKPASTNT